MKKVVKAVARFVISAIAKVFEVCAAVLRKVEELLSD